MEDISEEGNYSHDVVSYRGTRVRGEVAEVRGCEPCIWVMKSLATLDAVSTGSPWPRDCI